MPVLSSSYRAPLGLRGGHFATVFPTLFRRITVDGAERHRLELADGDFLDLDWTRRGNRRLAILGHGLEGQSRAKYILGMARALQRRGWDTLAWNCRGCSGEPNRLLRSYHSGASEDLASVVDHALTRDYHELALIGFSLGGNIVLKYLGERGADAPPEIKAAAVFSVPCDLTSSSLRLGEFDNRLYMARFMDDLKKKIIAKSARFPGRLDLTGLDRIRTFAEFDDRFTAPLNGFADARDYWQRASSRPLLSRIARPTLCIQAGNDPFLPPPCYPEDLAKDHPRLFLEIPAHGGHVGFITRGGEYWSETRAADFLAEHSRED